VNSPALRAALPADIDDVLHFWERAAEDAHRPIDTAESVGRLIARDPEALLLAVDAGVIVGSIIAGWDGWRAHLYRLAVDPRPRRAGIGRALIEAAETRLAALGASRFDAMVLDDNRLAQHAWEAAGYRRQPEWSRWVKPALEK
jgi:ribosomal protein S18 acetylase RimI-like enzyme